MVPVSGQVFFSSHTMPIRRSKEMGSLESSRLCWYLGGVTGQKEIEGEKSLSKMTENKMECLKPGKNADK